jgi:hypothetical protein
MSLTVEHLMEIITGLLAGQPGTLKITTINHSSKLSYLNYAMQQTEELDLGSILLLFK